MVGEPLDQIYTKSTHHLKFLDGFNEHFDTIQTHNFFGRSGKKLIRTPFEKRLPVYRSVMLQIKQLCNKRVIVSDYHADALQFKLPHLKGKSTIIQATNELLKPEFKFIDIVYSAGEGCPNRDMHLIYEI
jgi:hypothetical protein